MRYEVLGTIRIVDSAGSTFIGARKIEILLAALLARANQVVTTGQLMAEIWGSNPPARAAAALHVYISQLRKLLNRPADATAERAVRQAGRYSPIVTRPVGYLLAVGDGELDMHDFLALTNKGREENRSGRHEEATVSLERALSLWRGTAYDDLPDGMIIYSSRAWLEETRLEGIEMLMESYLNANRHREVIGRLYALTAEYPLRENLYRHLMLALYRSDRRADALAVYHDARKRVLGDLGLEPCHALQELNYAILTDDTRVHTIAA